MCQYLCVRFTLMGLTHYVYAYVFHLVNNDLLQLFIECKVNIMIYNVLESHLPFNTNISLFSMKHYETQNLSSLYIICMKLQQFIKRQNKFFYLILEWWLTTSSIYRRTDPSCGNKFRSIRFELEWWWPKSN